MRSPDQIKYSLKDKAATLAVWCSVIVSALSFWKSRSKWTMIAFFAAVLGAVVAITIWR